MISWYKNQNSTKIKNKAKIMWRLRKKTQSELDEIEDNNWE